MSRETSSAVLDDRSSSDELLLERAAVGVERYLRDSYESGALAKNYYLDAVENVLPRFRTWFKDDAIARLSPNLRNGLRDAVANERWEDITNAYIRPVAFGTGGIRALMAFDKRSILDLKSQGLDARILKGPHTINNIVVLSTAHGVARYLTKKYEGRPTPTAPTVVVGYDSRIQGKAFARVVTELLLAEGLGVYLFDEPVPYPEVTYAIPFRGADLGIFISASHNDYRYNGFKMSGPNGAQLPPEERDEILTKYINVVKPSDIRLVNLDTAPDAVRDRLVFLGGEKELEGEDYFGRGATGILDQHREHVAQVQRFLLRKTAAGHMEGIENLSIVFAAFNGSGRRVVPRILAGLGSRKLHGIRSLDPLDGLFPAFRSDPGMEQQPDPGDPRAAVIALAELERDRGVPGYIAWSDADLLLGTDPDADRCGVVVHPPADLASLLRPRPTARASERHVLVPADDMWALILWYRLHYEIESLGRVSDADKKFIALSHTTSDMIAKLATKYGLGVLKTWVGFGWLSNGVSQAWSDKPLPLATEGRLDPRDEKCDLVFYDTTAMNPRRKINVATMEQSNGFSILGGPPANPLRELGAGGHVRDKDGTFAALLVTEVAAYAKQKGTDILSLLADHVYCDPDVGLFVNYYEPDPIDGEYPGLAGETKKKRILDLAEEKYEQSRTSGWSLGGRKVTHVEKYATGKYDVANWPGFPDEGLRFYLGSPLDYLTIRPSGTTNSLRFHVQLFGGVAERGSVWQRRIALEDEARDMVTEIRALFGVERPAGVSF